MLLCVSKKDDIKIYQMRKFLVGVIEVYIIWIVTIEQPFLTFLNAKKKKKQLLKS